MTDDFETTVVHAGWEPDPITGAVVPPIQMSSTFKQDAVGQTRAGFEYGRSDNPTRRSLESAIAVLEGAIHGFAYASGLAATAIRRKTWTSARTRPTRWESRASTSTAGRAD